MTDKLRLDRAHLHHLLRQMLRIRRFEAKCVELYQAQKIRGFLHLYDGEEAIAAGLGTALQPGDAVLATTSWTKSSGFVGRYTVRPPMMNFGRYNEPRSPS